MSSFDLDIIRNYFASQPVIRAWLFGSCARGEDSAGSDVDILVSFDKSARVGLLRHAEIMLGLEDLLHRSVDLVSEGSLYPEVRRQVDIDKVLIYERDT